MFFQVLSFHFLKTNIAGLHSAVVNGPHVFAQTSLLPGDVAAEGALIPHAQMLGLHVAFEGVGPRGRKVALITGDPLHSAVLVLLVPFQLQGKLGGEVTLFTCQIFRQPMTSFNVFGQVGKDRR